MLAASLSEPQTLNPKPFSIQLQAQHQRVIFNFAAKRIGGLIQKAIRPEVEAYDSIMIIESLQNESSPRLASHFQNRRPLLLNQSLETGDPDP